MKRLILALALAPAIAGFADEFDVNTVEDLYAKVGTAGDGDIINVAPGTYKMTAALGTLVIDKGITVQSTGSWRDTFFEPEAGLTDMRLLKIAHAKGLFKGFTLRNVTSTANMTGMAFFIDDPSGGTVSDCRITNCSGTGTRYVVRMSLGSRIKRCRFDGNSANSVITVQLGSQSLAYGTSCQIVNCLICDNTCTPFTWDNTGNLSVKIVHCTIVDNNAGRVLSNPSREAEYRNSVLLPASVYPCAFNAPFDSSSLGTRGGTKISYCFYTGPNPGFKVCTYEGIVHGHPYDQFVNATANDYRPVAGSDLIGAATTSAYAEGVDIDGNPRGESSTIGCFEFDPNAVDTGLRVNVPAGGDIAAAVASAAAGTTIVLAEGEYTLEGTVALSKPLYIVGAGRDKTIIHGGTGFGLFTLSHYRSRISGLTVQGSKITETGGRAFTVSAGWIDDTRVTGISESVDQNYWGLAAYLNGGCLSRCQMDGNVSRYGKSNVSVLYLGSATPANFTKVGVATDCLIVNNEIGVSRDKRVGYGVYLTREGTGDGGRIYNSTVIGNYASCAIGASEYLGLVKNCIMADYRMGTTKQWGQGDGSSLKTEAQWLARTGTASTVWCNNCSASPIGSNCVSDPPKVRRNGKLAPSSPCIGAARSATWDPLDIDLAGNPRVREDGTQDIGCNQWMPSGLMLLVK